MIINLNFGERNSNLSQITDTWKNHSTLLLCQLLTPSKVDLVANMSLQLHVLLFY